MPLLHVLGESLVEQDELVEKIRLHPESVAKFAQAMRNPNGPDASPAMLTFNGAIVTATEATKVASAATTPIQDVGIGKPATVLIRHVYTGSYPKKGAFGSGGRDMLLTSAVRDAFTTFNMAPRAINFTKRRIPSYSNLIGPSATEDGTPVVYYSPAVTSQSTLVTFDLAFNDFDGELMDQIGGAVQTAGGIPVFGPYSGVLIGVGMAIKLISRLANSLVDSKPEFTETERLEFEVPGSTIPAAGFKVVCSKQFDHTQFRFEYEKGLVHKDTGVRYEGDLPYIVYLLDGTKNESLANFTPTAATAAQLSRFLSQKEGSTTVIEAIVDGLKLYNDAKFRGEADRLAKVIEKLPEDSTERVELEKKRQAFIANIISELLKPSNA